jgi:hypothetical protein
MQGKIATDLLFQESVSPKHHQPDAVLRSLLATHGSQKVQSLLPNRRGHTLGKIQQEDYIRPLIGLGEAQTHETTDEQQEDDETQASKQAPPQR